jgi:hypothetical protein
MNHPSSRTHYPSNNSDPSTIDFFLIKNITNYTVANTLHELQSDHYPVEMHINDVTRQNLDKYIHSYKNTDWKQFRNTLDTLIKINPKITTSEIDTEITKLTTTLIRARNKHSKRIKIKPGKSTIPQYEILEHIRIRNKTRKLFQRTGNNTYKI